MISSTCQVETSESSSDLKERVWLVKLRGEAGGRRVRFRLIGVGGP